MAWQLLWRWRPRTLGSDEPGLAAVFLLRLQPTGRCSREPQVLKSGRWTFGKSWIHHHHLLALRACDIWKGRHAEEFQQSGGVCAHASLATLHHYWCQAVGLWAHRATSGLKSWRMSFPPSNTRDNVTSAYECTSILRKKMSIRRLVHKPIKGSFGYGFRRPGIDPVVKAYIN